MVRRPEPLTLWSVSTAAAPVSRLLLCVIAVTSVAFSLINSKHPVTGNFHSGVAPRSLSVYLQSTAPASGLFCGTLVALNWLICSFTALSGGELTLALLAVSTCGSSVERFLGSARFVAVLLWLLVCKVTIFVTLSRVMFPSISILDWVPSSPSGLAVCLCLARRRLLPPSGRFVTIGSSQIAEESFTCDLLMLQLSMPGGCAVSLAVFRYWSWSTGSG